MPGRGTPRRPDAPAQGSRRLTVSVRLCPSVHGVLIEEFAKVELRRRAPRAAQLMTIGLLHERAYAQPGPALRETTTPSATSEPSEARVPGIRPEDAAFVSSILDSAGS